MFQRHITVERYNFLSQRQRDNESIDDYVTALKNLSQSCELGDLQQDLTRDVMICGLTKSLYKEKLLQEENSTLDKAVQLIKTYELTHTQALALHKQNDEQKVYAVTYRPRQGGEQQAITYDRGYPRRQSPYRSRPSSPSPQALANQCVPINLATAQIRKFWADSRIPMPSAWREM